jgi:hypothetical protein
VVVAALGLQTALALLEERPSRVAAVAVAVAERTRHQSMLLVA